MVKSIQPDGFLRIDKLGGVLDALLLGRKVWVNGHLGVVGVKSGHLQSADEKTRVTPLDLLYVDVGASSSEEVARMGIRIGDPWVWLSELEQMTNPDLLVGKAIDNRLSCAVLLQVLRELQGAALDGTLIALVAVQEEVGLRGAKVAAEHAAPDYAVCVDTFMSGDTPDVNYYREMPVGIGRGPVNLLANTGHIAHQAVAEMMEQSAGARRCHVAARHGHRQGQHRRCGHPPCPRGYSDGRPWPVPSLLALACRADEHQRCCWRREGAGGHGEDDGRRLAGHCCNVGVVGCQPNMRPRTDRR